MFILTEPTDDPARLKFLPGRPVMPEGTLDIRDRAEAARSPLAIRLFDVRGVAALSLGPDYITVTKEGGEWSHLKALVLSAIMDHFVSGAPVIREAAPAPGAAGSGTAGALVAQVTDALRLVIDPELGQNIVDLGLVYDVAVEDDGAASITMTTTTRGCPATNYLRDGAQQAAGSVEGVGSVEVELTYDPPWTPQMMTPEIKRRFGIPD
jgi:metal-sulfur cluster biosynthetic enzyme